MNASRSPLGAIPRSVRGLTVVHRGRRRLGAGCPQGFRRVVRGPHAVRHATSSVPTRCPHLAGLPWLRRCPGRPSQRAPVAQRRVGAAAPRHLRRRPTGPGPRPGLSRRAPSATARGGRRGPVGRLPARHRTCRRLHRRRARPRAPIATGRRATRPPRARPPCAPRPGFARAAGDLPGHERCAESRTPNRHDPPIGTRAAGRRRLSTNSPPHRHAPPTRIGTPARPRPCAPNRRDPPRGRAAAPGARGGGGTGQPGGGQVG